MTGRVLTFPHDGLERDCVIELSYLDAGRRVFVAVDGNGWKIGDGMACSDAEVDRVLHRLHDVLDAYRRGTCAGT